MVEALASVGIEHGGQWLAVAAEPPVLKYEEPLVADTWPVVQEPRRAGIYLAVLVTLLVTCTALLYMPTTLSVIVYFGGLTGAAVALMVWRLVKGIGRAEGSSEGVHLTTGRGRLHLPWGCVDGTTTRGRFTRLRFGRHTVVLDERTVDGRALAEMGRNALATRLQRIRQFDPRNHDDADKERLSDLAPATGLSAS